MEIKRLKPDDLISLCDLFEYNDVVDMLISNEKKIENGDIDIFGVFEGSLLIGELRVMYNHGNSNYTIKNKRVYLYALRVHEIFQGHGLGKFLLENVIDILKGKGYTEFTIGVEDDNEIAKKLYFQMGFNELVMHAEEEYQGDRYEYDLYLKK